MKMLKKEEKEVCPVFLDCKASVFAPFCSQAVSFLTPIFPLLVFHTQSGCWEFGSLLLGIKQACPAPC